MSAVMDLYLLIHNSREVQATSRGSVRSSDYFPLLLASPLPDECFFITTKCKESYTHNS